MIPPGIHIPDEAWAVTALSLEILSGDLVALYLHGSAVLGELRPQSDVDLLMVVKRELTDVARGELLDAMLEISSRYPAEVGGPRCIELLVFLKSDLSNLSYPACATFVYGEWLRKDFEAGAVPGPGTNPEFTLLLAQARLKALTLIGSPLHEIAPEVPERHVRQALREVVPSLLQNIEGDERNVLLTLARVWHTSETGRFIAKDSAADWATIRVSEPTAKIISEASNAYRQDGAGTWKGQATETREAAVELAAGALLHLGYFDDFLR